MDPSLVSQLLRAASPFWTPSGTTGQTLSSEAALSQVESLLREIKKRWEGPLVVSPETLPTTGEASEPHATDTPFTDTQSESPRASRGLVSPPLRQIRVAETPAFSAGSLLLGGGPSVMERQGKGGESAGGDPVSPRGHGGFAQWDFEQAGSHEGQGGEEGGRERRGLATSVRWKEMCMLGVGAWGGVDEELAKGNGVADASLKRAVKAKHASERVLDACQSPGEVRRSCDGTSGLDECASLGR